MVRYKGSFNSLSFFTSVFCIAMTIVTGTVSAQAVPSAKSLSKEQHWQLLDYGSDSVYGTSVNKAYKELLRSRKSKTIIVAVIDEGVDTTQEDLQGHIWTNRKEIPGNGIDDDGNGYVDDVHGWNFLGGKDGRNLYVSTSEADREYARLLPDFGNDTAVAATGLSAQRKYFEQVRKQHRIDSAGRKRDNSSMITRFLSKMDSDDSIVKSSLKKQHLFRSDLADFQPTDSIQAAAKKSLQDIYIKNPGSAAMPIDSIVRYGRNRLVQLKENHRLYSEAGDNPDLMRKSIIGDDPENIGDSIYGNAVVGDNYADHGTHCAGIIAAIRGNGKGMDGVTDNVLIMPVRAVNALKFGDERDKDVALAIRYAVNNGARIISMSFGKDYSPGKKWVDDAIRYADEMGVLIVHAAGNENRDTDSSGFYPTCNYTTGGQADNFINVGSVSSDTGTALPARDSNFGQRSVDLFAPGVDIYSCFPGNKYESMSGTSMATPMVAGIAALLMEYYPALTAAKIKTILMKTCTPLHGKRVSKPGTKDIIDFGSLSVTGGVVNAYAALKMAAGMK